MANMMINVAGLTAVQASDNKNVQTLELHWKARRLAQNLLTVIRSDQIFHKQVSDFPVESTLAELHLEIQAALGNPAKTVRNNGKMELRSMSFSSGNP